MPETDSSSTRQPELSRIEEIGPNFYAFALNSPVHTLEYLGLAPFCVCIRCGDDHCWIAVKDQATGTINTYGRWKRGYGPPPATSSGVRVDTELGRAYKAGRCLQTDTFTPTINAGYSTCRNNCATYAKSEWNRVFGESLSAGWPCHLPGTLKDSIKSQNGGAWRHYGCCFSWGQER